MFDMSAFSDELVKIAAAKIALLEGAGKFLTSRPAKYLGVAGLGGVGVMKGKQALDDLVLGRRVRQQMEESQQGA